MIFKKLIPVFIACLLQPNFIGAMDQSVGDDAQENQIAFDHLKGHTGIISCLATVSTDDDNEYIISGSSDRTIRIWNRQTKECTDVLIGHRETVTSVKVIDQGYNNYTIVSASQDKTIRLWDLKSGEYIAEMSIQDREPAAFVAIEVMDASKIITLDALGWIDIWDLVSRSAVKSFQANQENNEQKYLSYDGNRSLASASNHTISMWNIDEGSCYKQVSVPHKITGLVNIKFQPRCVVGTFFVPEGKQVQGFYEVWQWINNEEIFECPETANVGAFPLNICRFQDSSILACTSGMSFSVYNYDTNQIEWWERNKGYRPSPSIVAHLNGYIVFGSEQSNDLMVSQDPVLPQ